MSNLLNDGEFVLHLSIEEYMNYDDVPDARHHKTKPKGTNPELGIIDVYRALSSLVYQVYFKDAESMMNFQLQYL